MYRLVLKIKWTYLRWLVKRHRIGFNKMMLRMFWIQELAKLPQYDVEKLAWYNYSKIKKLYIKEYPNEKLHDPYNYEYNRK